MEHVLTFRIPPCATSRVDSVSSESVDLGVYIPSRPDLDPRSPHSRSYRADLVVRVGVEPSVDIKAEQIGVPIAVDITSQECLVNVPAAPDEYPAPERRRVERTDVIVRVGVQVAGIIQTDKLRTIARRAVVVLAYVIQGDLGILVPAGADLDARSLGADHDGCGRVVQIGN